MAFSKVNSKGTTYYLHANTKVSKAGKEYKLYFFSKDIREDKAVDSLPEGYEVSELKTGMFVLKKK